MQRERGTGTGRAAVGALVSAAMLVGLGGLAAGCKRDDPQVSAIDAMNGADPSDANMAPVQASDAEAAAEGVGTPAYADAGQPGYAAPATAATRRVYQGSANGSSAGYRRAPAGTLNESQAAAQNYSNGQAPAPVERRAPDEYSVPGATQAGYQQDGGYQNGGYQNGGYQDGYPTAAQAGDDAQQLSDALDANVDPNEVAAQPPPPLPDYEQPPAPEDDYLWTPGYWGYAPAGYYWVPGAWVSAPFTGALWTPGYWGPWHGRYCFHHGYWGRYVGFYGGIAYGFGYYGTGYHGGFWNGNHFAYNRAVTNVNIVNVRNVYNRTVIVNNVRINNSVTNRYVNNVNFNNRVSYNGGRGGVQARPEAAELAALRQRQVAPLPAQRENQRAAEMNRGQFFAQRQERPVTVVARPIQTERVAAPVLVPTRGPVVSGQPVAGGRQGFVGGQQGVTGGRPVQQQPVAAGFGRGAQAGVERSVPVGANGRFDQRQLDQRQDVQRTAPAVAGQPQPGRGQADQVDRGRYNGGTGYGNGQAYGVGRANGVTDQRAVTAQRGVVDQRGASNVAPTWNQGAGRQQVFQQGDTRQQVFQGGPGRQQVFQNGQQGQGDQQAQRAQQAQAAEQQRQAAQQQRVQEQGRQAEQQQRQVEQQQQRQAEQQQQRQVEPQQNRGWQGRPGGAPVQQQAPQQQQRPSAGQERSVPMRSQPQPQQQPQQRSAPAPQGGGRGGDNRGGGEGRR